MTFEDLKAQVDKFAKIFDWNTTIQLIEEFLKTNQESDKRIFELLGDCNYNLAFQQNTRDEFKQVIHRAKEAYEKAEDDLRCKARSSLCKYWESDDPDERRELIISKCLPFERQLIQLPDSANNEDAIAKIYAELLETLFIACSISKSSYELRDLVRETTANGRTALASFKSSSNPETSLVANEYIRFAGKAYALYFNEDESQKFAAEISNDIIPLISRLSAIAENSELDARLRCLAFETVGRIEAEFKTNFSGSTYFWKNALQLAEKTKDQFLIGWILAGQSFYLIWIARGIDIPEKASEILEQASRQSARAIKILKVPLATWEMEIAYYAQIKSQTELFKIARDDGRAEHIEKAILVGRESEAYDSFTSMRFAISALSEALRYAARLTHSKTEREKLLSEAIVAAKEGVLGSGELWNRGISLDYLGLLKSDLSREKNDPQEREMIMADAAADLLEGASILDKSWTVRGRETRVAQIYEDLGDVLGKFYETSEKHPKDRAIECIRAYDNATRYYGQANLAAYLPQISWKVAKIYDLISDYSKSANAFNKASQQYKEASKNQKSLEKSFDELSQYMLAWSKIEESRLSHTDEDYVSSAQRLSEVSSLLAKTESYKFLSKHYEAYSAMEQAEDYSRKEKNQEASESFWQASELYAQAEQDATRHGKEIDDLNWATISKNRGNYCLARKAMEDARILDRNAQPEASMRKYRAASDILKEIIGKAKSQQDVGDVEALALSCEAFATMKQAEYSTSSELYSRAAELFNQAKESREVKQSFILSCRANAAISKAFEAGTKYKATRDPSLYGEIKNQLGIASQYYEEAGFEIASDWTRATEALFDALAYLAAAEREMDTTKKTQMYHVAEKNFELSARRYGDIGYDKKRQEVLKHLKTARENREVFLSPMEALSQNPTVSSSPVSFTRDQAVGLERFEVANLTGNISVSTKQTNVGSPIKIDIDIANVGKTPALLMKLDNVAPLDAFEVEGEKNPHHFLESETTIGIDLKGKRLEYLKAHEMSFYLIAKSKGDYEIKPKIVFVDELGKYRSYEFDSQHVLVIGTERRLVAIMFTDMAGYTALGQRNESLSIALVNEQRKLLRPIFKRHNGREVKTIGDAFLVEFASSLDAARCAYDIQRAVREFNISLPEDKRITLRVGVHLGDVVVSENGDISGDAVNVASRIEPLAEHGGVCLTRQVYDNIQNKFDLKLESLGLKSLKNVSSQIEVFKMVMPWE